MFHVQMTFARSIEREQERSDEGQLQIAGITISGGVVTVNMQTVELKQQVPIGHVGSWPDHLGTFRNPVRIATISASDPFFAYVIRAIEKDNSNDRAGDLQRFSDSIQQSAQRALEERRLPTVDDIWLGGNTPNLADRRWRDDDDKIGVSARTYADYGTILAEPNPVIDPPVSGSLIPGSRQLTELLFRGDGAMWRVEVSTSALWA